ncbi:hypothetical protein L218DRAFT_962219 [Marasmius fiardii PR-910]|nr:hypothetical protein L218DRAFT_962219 [Marasmius fiardii PR-910]
MPQQPTPSSHMYTDGDLTLPIGLTESPMFAANPSVSSSSPSQNWIDMKNAQRAVVESGTIERQHHDSGVRYPRSRNVVDIPPTYTES